MSVGYIDPKETFTLKLKRYHNFLELCDSCELMQLEGY